MSEPGFPVTIPVARADGKVEHVRVGTAWKSGEGFTIKFADMTIGARPDAAPAPRATTPIAASGTGAVFPNYGRSKGAPIAGASLGDLEYYANGARRSLADPSKSRWHDKERALLAAIEAEIARQQGGVAPMASEGPPTDEGAPPIGDEDIPF